ncbi:MAG: nicotinamidase [Candidatus Bathyarchaeota archaeon]|nr:MAG: nicotinamidase [Candidatus Bathyarchaeota archaeon]
MQPTIEYTQDDSIKLFTIGVESALVVVDVQKDFCLGGALPVPQGDAIVPVLNRYIQKFEEANAPIYATRDWHPPNHISFTSQGGPWPPHCIQNTKGAEFHDALKLPQKAIIVSKADPNKEAYSGFDGTNLEKSLQQRGVRKVFVGGLATDYCVKSTVIAALKLGFEAVLLMDAIRGVNVKPGDSERALEEMMNNGAQKTMYSHTQLAN